MAIVVDAYKGEPWWAVPTLRVPYSYSYSLSLSDSKRPGSSGWLRDGLRIRPNQWWVITHSRRGLAAAWSRLLRSVCSWFPSVSGSESESGSGSIPTVYCGWSSSTEARPTDAISCPNPIFCSSIPIPIPIPTPTPKTIDNCRSYLPASSAANWISNSRSAVWRRLMSWLRMAMASALRVPTRTASLRARVKPV
jgi:hypothetical protein